MVMEAEEFFNLFDSYWFEHQIFLPDQNNSACPAASQSFPQIEDSNIPNLLQVRSLSDQCTRGLLGDNFFYKNNNHILQEVAFIKQAEAAETQENIKKSRGKNSSKRRKKKDIMRRSSSALEFDEVKGFIDLGFVFSEEDMNSSLVSIIPGLEKWGKDGELVKENVEVSRPYLSEAWGVVRQQGKLIKWRFPSVNNEIDMKDQLRVWAHNVASVVR